MMKRIIAIVFGLWFLASDGTLQGTPITYEFSGIGSGSLGTNLFANSPFTITSIADTIQITFSQITNPMATIFKVLNSSATVSISGIGNANFTVPTTTADNQNGGLVIGDLTQNFAILAVNNLAFKSYDLRTSIGPFSGPPGINSFAHFATSAGNFSLTSVSTASFQAFLQSVPEPSSLSLIVLCMLVRNARLWPSREK